MPDLRLISVLFDTWFTTAPMLKEIRNLGLHVIGMLKHMNNSCYIYKGRKHTLKSLKEHLERTGGVQTPKKRSYWLCNCYNLRLEEKSCYCQS